MRKSQRIRMIKLSASPAGVREVGSVHKVDREEARRLFRSGAAEPAYSPADTTEAAEREDA